MTPSWTEGALRIVDKVYGEIGFPEFIKALLVCPAVMRLREVRMGNINFLCYPGFAETTRFEHSLGTCYLASLAAKKLGLSLRDTLTLMSAALYHDVATPPFAHAAEDVFTEYFGFNHEDKLFEILSGKHTATEVASGQYAPVFLGRRAILSRICRSMAFREIGVDPFQVARTAHGEGLLGQLISGDIDLDNLDNVVRAAMNMGLGSDPNVAIRLAMAFYIEGAQVCISPSNIADVHTWQRLRWRVYDGIFTDYKDFSLQSMLKLAIVRAIEDGSVIADHWSCTDNELLYTHLVRSREASRIIERIRLGDLFETLFVVSIKESAAKEKVMSYKERRKLETSIVNQLGIPSIINYYVDKRLRQPRNMPNFEQQPIGEANEDNLIVGVFTPSRKTLSTRLKEESKRVLSSGLEEELGDIHEVSRVAGKPDAVQGTLEIKT